MYDDMYGNILGILDKDIAIAHCISADYTLGAGLAKQLNKRLNLTEDLNSIGNHSFPDCIPIKREQVLVYNLVTKATRYDRPNYADLESALYAMKQHMLDNNIKEVYVPHLGCGKDGLSWPAVEQIITELFEKEPFISVYSLDFVIPRKNKKS